MLRSEPPHLGASPESSSEQQMHLGKAVGRGRPSEQESFFLIAGGGRVKGQCILGGSDEGEGQASRTGLALTFR